MAAGTEELVEKLDELKPLLERTLASEKGVFDAAGKPFDLTGWLLGQPLDQKYPTGPAYKVRHVLRRAAPCSSHSRARDDRLPPPRRCALYLRARVR